MRVPNAIAALLALALFAAPAAALPEDQTVFTSFEGITTAPEQPFVVGVSPDSAEFTGDAFSASLGIPALYHFGFWSWMVVANDTGMCTGMCTGMITFKTDADIVEFYARVRNNAIGSTVITAFDGLDVIVDGPVIVAPGTGWQLISLNGGIAWIEVVNLDGSLMNGIDDFGFTPLPEPSAVLTLASGAALLGVIGRRRYAR
jgi:hypothetical protein